MVFWFCCASSTAGLCFVPFLTIGTQGGRDKSISAEGSDKSLADAEASDPKNVPVEKVHPSDIRVVPDGEASEKGI